MNPKLRGLGAVLFLLAIHLPMAMAAPPCKGPNKNDPGCGEEAPAVDPVVVDSVTVDWLNEELTVRGSGFTGATSFTLGTSAVPLPTTDVTATLLNIPFNTDIAAEVITQGNYKLEADGTEQLSVFIESQIIDPAATGCTCELDWASELGLLWTDPPQADCLEIEGPGANDIADISGTVLTDPADAAVYPHYPIGASFYPGDPDSSVCRLVQVNADATAVDLVNLRINENQQADCAAALIANVCATVTPLP